MTVLLTIGYQRRLHVERALKKLALKRMQKQVHGASEQDKFS